MKLCCSTSRQLSMAAKRWSKQSARTARNLFVPFTVGGGVRTLEDAAKIFDAGADKVSINSAAVANPALIAEIAGRFGSQAVIVAIDARRGAAPANTAEVFVSGGRTATVRKRSSGRGKQKSGAPAKSSSPPWTATAPALALTASLRAIAGSVSIPVIASGGAGSAQHFVEVFSAGKADAALAATIFHFGTHAVAELKQTLFTMAFP